MVGVMQRAKSLKLVREKIASAMVSASDGFRATHQSRFDAVQRQFDSHVRLLCALQLLQFWSGLKAALAQLSRFPLTDVDDNYYKCLGQASSARPRAP